MAFRKRYSKSDHARTGQSKKFGNIKKEYDGIKFDSAFEISVYKDLLIYKAEGLIDEVVPHPPAIQIYPSTKHELGDGTKYLYREVQYNPDFMITVGGVSHYVDVKSFPTITADFILKFKMCYHQLGIYLIIITKESWKGRETIDKILNGTFYSALSKNKLKSLE